MTTLTPTPKQQFFDANGNPLAGGKVYTYAAGTTTPLVTYTDESGSTPNTNPVILDSRGEAAIWLGAAFYKLKLTTSTDVEIWTVDNVSSAVFRSLEINSGNLNFSGTGQRITGDCSTTTYANRLAIQTNVTNGSSNPFVLPNGTSTQAQIVCANASDPTNSSYGAIGVIGTSYVRVSSAVLGTGTLLPMVFDVGGERMRITSAGNVGIGTTTPDARLHMLDTSAGGAVYGHFANSSGAANSTAVISLDPGNNGVNTRDAQIRGVNNGANQIVMSFWTSNSAAPVERMRIDFDGNLLVGTTSNIGPSIINSKSTVSATACIGMQNTGGAGSIFSWFVNAANSATIGSISNSGNTSTSYNTTSDYRLKENVTPIAGALAKVAALKPVSYTWKVDGSDGEGFIAHELQAVCPLAVTGEKDAVNEDGKPVHQGIDPSKIIGLLTAAIQEQQATITALTNRISALEAK
jgi:hypothetical protein